MNALLKAHRERWFPNSPLLRFARRSRGFIQHARGSATDFIEHAAVLFGTEPMTSFYLESGSDSFDEFAGSPLLERLRTIDFPQDSLQPGGLAKIIDEGHLSSIRNLELSYWQGNPAELQLFSRSYWPELRQMSWLGCGLDDSALAILARLDAPRLKSLSFAMERIGEAGLHSLLRTKWAKNLTHLSLQMLNGTFGSAGLAGVIDHPQLANLRYLDLSRKELGHSGIRKLARNHHLGQLRHIDVSQTQGGALGFLELFSNQALRQVRDLSYSGNGSSFGELAGQAVELRSVSPWPDLRKLYLSGNWLGDEGFRWSLSQGLLGNLRQLWAHSMNLTWASFDALLRSSLPLSLVTLNLGSNRFVVPEGFPSALDFPKLLELDLVNCQLGERGGAALLRALRAPRLRDLTLYQNDLGNETVHEIASNRSFRNLEKLSLSYHSAIDDEGARLLAESPYLDRLDLLQLMETSISTRALARLRQRFRRVWV